MDRIMLFTIMGMAIIMYLVINTFLTEDWSHMDSVMLFHERKPARVVISMSTFARRLETTGLDIIRDLIKNQRYDRLIVTVSLVHRNSTGKCDRFVDCVSDDRVRPIHTVAQCLHIFDSAFGPFKALTPPRAHPSVLPYENGKLYLQIMTTPDYGPATKLLGALIAEPDPHTVIVTVDDDVYYVRNYVSQLAHYMPRNGTLGSQFQYLDSGRTVAMILLPDIWRVFANGYGFRFEGWLMGVAGVAYRRSYFDDGIFREARQLSRECFLNDDVWVCGYLRQRGIHPHLHLGVSSYGHRRHATESLSTIKGAQQQDMVKCAKSYGFPFP